MPDVSTVGELMDYLATQPRDRKIIMSSDAEGNSYSPLADAGEGMYFADSTWSGEVHMTPEDFAEEWAKPGHGGYAEEDEPPGDDDPDAERVVVLGPVN